MTSTPDKVFAEAVEWLDERGDHPPYGIYPALSGQPFDGKGYVFAQVGWVADKGLTYGLRLPDNMERHGTTLRPLYVCLGCNDTPAPEECA